MPYYVTYKLDTEKLGVTFGSTVVDWFWEKKQRAYSVSYADGELCTYDHHLDEGELAEINNFVGNYAVNCCMERKTSYITMERKTSYIT